MPTLSLRLPDDVDARLDHEAGVSLRPKSEIARQAITDFLLRLERERFQQAILRAARAGGDAEALEIAAEALPLDNEALALKRSRSVHEPRAAYRVRSRRKQ
jgi:predicted transcriptional regulator